MRTFDASDCPVPHMARGFKDYVEHGIPMGSFGRAFLENNLREAFARADLQNRYSMYELVQWAYMKLPAPCWGSPKNVKLWIEHNGFNGKEMREGVDAQS